MAADAEPGAMLVLPWHLYIGFPWNGDRVVLDPAQRYFTRRAVGNDDLELKRVTVPGEDPYSDRLGPLVRGTAPLAPALPAHGIRYVLVLKVAEWADFTPRLAGARRLLDGRRRPARAGYGGLGRSGSATGSSPGAPPAAIVRRSRRREPTMSPTVRVFIALAVGALLLAFAASLTLVTASSGENTSNRPLVVYGGR
jgi:hypothetical protein